MLDEEPRKIDTTQLSDMTEPRGTEEDAAATTAAKKTRKTSICTVHQFIVWTFTSSRKANEPNLFGRDVGTWEPGGSCRCRNV